MKDEIMRLADAYAEQMCRSGEGQLVDEARAALEAAVLAQGEPVTWMEMVVANLVREGVNKHKARELAQHFATHPAPGAKQEPVAWMYQNANTDSEYLVWKRSPGGRNWKPLYTHPAPVNQALLERISELEALNERLWVALKGYHSNSAKQDWPEDIWIAAEVALREAAIAQAEGKV